MHHITTHADDGTAVFYENSSNSSPPKIPIPIGTLSTIYSTNNKLINLSSTADIDFYLKDREGLPRRGQICPPNGTSVLLMNIAPGIKSAKSPMHRTMTLDVLVMLSGEIRLHLDSGATRILKAGDSIVQRGTMHAWENVTPEQGVTSGWASWVVFVQAIDGPIEVGDKKLEAAWPH